MLRIVYPSFIPLLRTQIKSVGHLKQIKSQINVHSFRPCSTNFNAQEWCETLDEAKRKRINHIRNEVGID